ncbi:MAG: hypothetical protein OEV89_07460 [Desulfobulbaceae bacterium]|nr:hypothetical protein [Desulfobulbaceae bacterium]HIJ90590.1 hypothetical protein [Deltaproteobacteria bacterium]
MIANCPNLIGSVKTVAWGNGAGGGYGAGYGAGCGTGGGMGMHTMAGGCKAACGAVLGHGLLPLALIAAVGYLGYKVYAISKNEVTGGPVKSVSAALG